MLERAKRTKTAGRLFGNRFGLVASLSRSTDSDGLHVGRMNTFVDIDQARPWLDMKTDEAALTSRVETIRLPPDLKPEYVAVDFYFHPTRHRLFFQWRFAPRSMARAFMNILNDTKINQSDSPVAVTVVQSKTGLDRIFNIKQLTTLRITVQRPNPDDLGDLDDQVEKRLANQRADSLTFELNGTDEKGLDPDRQTRGLAHLALENGLVEGFGRDEKLLKVAESTALHPRIIQETYDPEEEAEIDAFRRAVRRWL